MRTTLFFQIIQMKYVIGLRSNNSFEADLSPCAYHATATKSYYQSRKSDNVSVADNASLGS